jgi:hypothetical protein
MKRTHILGRPVSVSDLDAMDIDEYGQDWNQKAERARVKQLRKLRREIA